MTMTEGKREREERQAAPHTMGCFEAFAEIMIEQGRALTGEGDEVIGARTIMEIFHDERPPADRCSCLDRSGGWGEED